MGTTTDQPDYGSRIRERRNAAGLSLSATRDILRDTIPRRYVPSIKTLQRIEAGEVPEEKVEGILIYGLAAVFKCRVSDLSQLVAGEFDDLNGLVASSLPCTTTCPGQLVLLAVA